MVYAYCTVSADLRDLRSTSKQLYRQQVSEMKLMTCYWVSEQMGPKGELEEVKGDESG